MIIRNQLTLIRKGKLNTLIKNHKCLVLGPVRKYARKGS